MTPHSSGDYCERWTGDISSDKEVESSVCQCDRKGEKYCQYWTCKERGLKMCEKGGIFWCNFPLAVGMAGSFGVIVTLCSLACVLSAATDEVVARNEPDFWQVLFVVLVGVLCLPWTAAVVIWGGVRGVMWVGLMWGISFLISGVALSLRRYV